MKIDELFVNRIDRYIDPVIKIEDEKNILNELEEYVVTDKIAENLIKFFEKFNETAQHERKDIGVWISGFFGSGKSHFAKILGYLLENKQIDGRTARDIFQHRITGLEREMEINGLLHETSLKIKAHTIMYQIESEHDQLAEKKSISKTIYKQFLKSQGLSDDLHIAELEQDLISKGKYQEFKDKIKEITGKDWVDIFDNGQYEYISGAKKLIEEEISTETVKNHEIKRFASDKLSNILDIGRLNYENVKYFDINVFADDNELSSKGDITLKVYSPIFLEFKAVDKASVLDSSHKSLETVFWLSNPDIKIENDIKKYLRTQKVIERRDKNEKKSAEEIAIIREKRESLEALSSGIESSIKQALLSGNIIYDGNDEVLTGKTDNIKNVFEKELSKVVPYIYSKFDDAKFKVNEKSIAAMFTHEPTSFYKSALKYLSALCG